MSKRERKARYLEEVTRKAVGQDEPRVVHIAPFDSTRSDEFFKELAAQWSPYGIRMVRAVAVLDSSSSSDRQRVLVELAEPCQARSVAEMHAGRPPKRKLAVLGVPLRIKSSPRVSLVVDSHSPSDGLYLIDSQEDRPKPRPPAPSPSPGHATWNWAVQQEPRPFSRTYMSCPTCATRIVWEPTSILT